MTGQATSLAGGLPTVTVVIPAYNEEALMTQTLEAVTQYLDGRPHPFTAEVLVVNDGSRDRTGALADEFAATHPAVRVLHHTVNRNLGQALRSAFAHVRSDYVVTLDCDLSYSVDHIERLVGAITTSGADLVLASPYAAGGSVGNVPFLRRFLSRYANRYLSVGVKGELSTLTGMVRVYDRRFLQSLDLTSRDSSINTEIVYKARILGARIEEIPARLDWGTPIPGRSSSARIVESAKTYLLSGFLFRPLLTLAIPGFAFLSLCVAAFVYGIGDALLGRRGLGDALADSPATIIVSAICFVVALQFFGLGFLAWQAKRNFENLFHVGTTNLRRSQSLEPPT